MSEGSGFFSELTRRHVWRVAVAYALAGWLVVQVTTQVFPFFRIPDWAVRLVVILLVIGFVVAVLWSWIYELTPEGIRRTAPTDAPEARESHDTHAVGRKLNTVIITVLLIAAALLLGNQFLWHQSMRAAAVAPPPASTAKASAASAGPAPGSSAKLATTVAVANAPLLPATTAAIPQKSVAVLPFTNEGATSEQFFSDGLSEDLINALSQFEGLKVISRNSAFQFRGSKDSSARIGQLLGVAHLLEGSVQRADDTVRITATLVNAADGSTLWSEQYDKPYQDLFALQDAITHAVATALKAELLTAPGAVVQSDRPPSGNIQAYTAYQHGLAYYALGTETSLHQAIDAFNAAIRLDPKYAAAYALLGSTWNGFAGQFLAGKGAAQANAKARAAVQTALKLDPDSALAHRVYASLLRTIDFDWAGAEAEARRALQLAPNDAGAQFSLGVALATLGQVQRAADLTRRALQSDPRHATRYSWLSSYLSGLGKLDAAHRASGTAIALQPGAVGNHMQLAIIEILRGDAQAALAAAQAELPGAWHDVAVALATQIGPDRAAADAALKHLIDTYADLAPYQIAQAYALRKDPDNTFKWLEHAWTARDPGVGNLLSDPFNLRYRDDPRFAAYAHKIGLPATTDAVAMK